MSTEDRLESLERSILLLNDSMQELIKLYIETQTNPILGDLQIPEGFEPKIVKDRNARARLSGQQHWSLYELRELTEALIDTRGKQFTSRILGRYNSCTLAELSVSDYPSYASDALKLLNPGDQAIP